MTDKLIKDLIDLYGEFESWIICNVPHYVDSDFSLDNFIKFLKTKE